jgi:hypothetical protein
MFADDDTDAVDATTLFESYFDRDSGVWSLRRIPTTPPQELVDESKASPDSN